MRPKAKGTVGYIKISKRSTYKRIGMEPEHFIARMFSLR